MSPLDAAATTDGAGARAALRLSWDQRRHSRLRATLDDGRDVAIVLARGACLRAGDLLSTEDGALVVEVQGAPETVTTATAESAADVVRAAYHLGNRHVPVQLGADWVRYQHDHVLDAMVAGLGLSVRVEQAVFSPEGGAYGDAGGHRHRHQHGHGEHSHGEHAHHDERAPTPTPRSAASILSLLTLCSPTLPIGGFSWSDGLEAAIATGQVHDKDSVAAWIGGRLGADIAYLELPMLARLCAAWHDNDLDAVERLNASLGAWRETAELAASSNAMGRALARLLSDLGVAQASRWRDRDDTELATLLALAAVDAGLDTTDTLLGYGWSWLDTQVAAAVKLVPLGQTDGQRLIRAAHPDVVAAVELALTLDDDDLGFAMPGLAIASSQHERQRVRLFRS